MMIHEFSCRVKTTDDWCGTFEDGTVKLTLFIPDEELLLKAAEGAYRFRVCVWGTDDYGMERDFSSPDDMHSALNLYHTLKKSDDLTVRLCQELSLTSA
jgi:hypothetical protein